MVVYRKPVSARLKPKQRKVTSKYIKTVARRNAYTPYKASGTNPQTSVIFRGIGFPDKLTTNLVYSESFILTPSAGTPTPYLVYKLNSLYDPNDAVGGGQPTYHDQLSLIYKRYAVIGAKVTAMFSLSTQTVASTGPYICGVQTSDANTLPTSNASVLMSAPNTSFKVVSQDDGTSSVVGTYSRNIVFPDQGTNTQARVNADPAVLWYAKIFASPQGTVVTAPMNVVIIIEYNAEYSDATQVVDA